MQWHVFDADFDCHFICLESILEWKIKYLKKSAQLGSTLLDISIITFWDSYLKIGFDDCVSAFFFFFEFWNA